jgi:hypothetical protein
VRACVRACVRVQYMYMYNLSCLRYFKQNIQISRQNKIT